MRENVRDRNNRSPEENWRSNVSAVLGEDYVKKILSFNKLDTNEFKNFNNQIQSFVKNIANNVSSSRLRKLFELIKKSKNSNDLLMTIPYLAYMVGREENKGKKEALGELYVVLKDTIEQVKDEKEHIDNIKKFAEVLVAYQKFYGKD